MSNINCKKTNKIINCIKKVFSKKSFIMLGLLGVVAGTAYVPFNDSNSDDEDKSNAIQNVDDDSNYNVGGYTDDEMRKEVVDKVIEQKKEGFAITDLDVDMYYGTRTGEYEKVQAKNADGSLKFDYSHLDSEGNPQPVYTFQKKLVDQRIKIENATADFVLPGSLKESYMDINLPITYENLGLMSMSSCFSEGVMYFDMLTKEKDKLNLVDAKYKVSTNVGDAQEIIDCDGEIRYVDSPSELSGLLSHIINGIAVYADSFYDTDTDPSGLVEKNYDITIDDILYGNPNDNWSGLFDMKVEVNKNETNNGIECVDYYASIPLNPMHADDDPTNPDSLYTGIHIRTDANFNLKHVDFPAFHSNDPHGPKDGAFDMLQFKALGSRIRFALHADFENKVVDKKTKSPAEQKEYKSLSNAADLLLGAYHLFKAPRLAIDGEVNVTHAINGPMYDNIKIGQDDYLNLGSDVAVEEQYESLYIALRGASDHSNKLVDHKSSVAYQQFFQVGIGTYDKTIKNGSSFILNGKKLQHEFEYLWKQELHKNFFLYKKLNDGESVDGNVKVKLDFIETSRKIAQIKEILVPIIDSSGGFTGESEKTEKTREDIFAKIESFKDKGIGRTIYKICDDLITYRDESKLNSIKEKGTFEGAIDALESVVFGNDGSIKVTIDLSRLIDIEGIDQNTLSGIISFACKTNGDGNDTFELVISDGKFGGFYIDDTKVTVTRCTESQEEYEKKYIDGYIDVNSELEKYTEINNINPLWDYFMNLYEKKQICINVEGTVMEDVTDSKGNLLNTNAGIFISNQLSFDGQNSQFADELTITRQIPTILNDKRTGTYLQEYKIFADGIKKTRDFKDKNGDIVYVNGKPLQVIDKDNSNVFIHEESYPVYKDKNGDFILDAERNKNRPHKDAMGINAILSVMEGEQLIELVKCIPSLSADYGERRYSNLAKLFSTKAKVKKTVDTFMNGVIDENKLNNLVKAKILTDFNLNANEDRGVLTMKFTKDLFNFMPDTVEFTEDIEIVIEYHSEKKINKESDRKMIFDKIGINTRLGDYDPAEHDNLPADGKTQFDRPKVNLEITFLDYDKNTVEDRFYYNENSKEEPKNYGHNAKKPFTNMQSVADIIRYAINDSVAGTGLKIKKNKYGKWTLLGQKHGTKIAPSTYHIKLGLKSLNVPIFGDMKSMFNLEFFIYVEDDKVRMMMYLKLPCVGEPIKGSTTFNFTYRHFNSQTKAKDYYYNSVCVFEDGFNDEEKENGGIAYLYRYTSWDDDEHGPVFWRYNNNGFFDYRKVKGNDFKENLVEWVAYYMANLYNYKDYGKTLLGKTNDEDGQNSWYPEDILSNFAEDKNNSNISMSVYLRDMFKDKPFTNESVLNLALHHSNEYLTAIDIKGSLIVNLVINLTVTIDGSVKVVNLTDGIYKSCYKNPLFMGEKYQKIVDVVGDKCGYTDVPYTERMWNIDGVERDAYKDYPARRDGKYKTTSGKWTSTGSWHDKPITW